MPKTVVLFYREADGTVPLREWILGLNTRAQERCFSPLRRLEVLGHEIRRPTADYLRDGIYELRVRHGRVNLRMLYFFQGTAAVVVSHGLTKEGEIPPSEIARAVVRKGCFKSNPAKHGVRDWR